MDYNEALCNERHAEIQREFTTQKQRSDKMEKKIDILLALAFSILVTTIGALIK